MAGFGPVRLRGLGDLAFAAAYGWIGFHVAPSRSTAVEVVLGVVVGLLALAGASELFVLPWARLVARIAAGLLLVACAVGVALLVCSFAYLRTIWGPLGQGAAWVSVVAAALLVEACGLWPIAQLRFYARPEVRRFFLR